MIAVTRKRARISYSVAAIVAATLCIPLQSAHAYSGHGSPFEGISTPNYPVWGVNSGDVYLSGSKWSSGYFYSGDNGDMFLGKDIVDCGDSPSAVGCILDKYIGNTLNNGYGRGGPQPDFVVGATGSVKQGDVDSNNLIFFEKFFPYGNARSLSRIITGPGMMWESYIPGNVNNRNNLDTHMAEAFRRAPTGASAFAYDDSQSETTTIPLEKFGCLPSWPSRVDAAVSGEDGGTQTKDVAPYYSFKKYNLNNIRELSGDQLTPYERLFGDNISYTDCLWTLDDSEEKSKRLKTLALSQSLMTKLISGEMTADEVKDELAKGGFSRADELEALTNQAGAQSTQKDYGIHGTLRLDFADEIDMGDGPIKSYRFDSAAANHETSEKRQANDAESLVAHFAYLAYEKGFTDGLVMPPPLTDNERLQLRDVDNTEMFYGWQGVFREGSALEHNRNVITKAYFELFTKKRSFDDYPEAAAYLDKLGISWRGGEYVGDPGDKDVLVAILNYVSNRALSSFTEASKRMTTSADNPFPNVYTEYTADAFDYPAILDEAYAAVTNNANGLEQCVADAVNSSLKNATVDMTTYHEKLLNSGETPAASEVEAVIGVAPELYFELYPHIEVPSVDNACDTPTTTTETTTSESAPSTSTTTEETTTTGATTTSATTGATTDPSATTSTEPSSAARSTTSGTTTTSAATTATLGNETSSTATTAVTTTAPSATQGQPRHTDTRRNSATTTAYASGSKQGGYTQRFTSVAPGASAAAVGPMVDTGGHVERTSWLKSVLSKVFHRAQ